MISLSSLIKPSSIEAVLACYPDLCNNGFQYCDRGQLLPSAGAEFVAARKELLKDSSIDEILTGIAYIIVHGAPAHKDDTSYTLKHRMERWGRTVGLAGHVCNGSAIVAAALVGYEIIQKQNDPNCFFKANPHTVKLGSDEEEDNILEAPLCL